MSDQPRLTMAADPITGQRVRMHVRGSNGSVHATLSIEEADSLMQALSEAAYESENLAITGEHNNDSEADQEQATPYPNVQRELSDIYQRLGQCERDIIEMRRDLEFHNKRRVASAVGQAERLAELERRIDEDSNWGAQRRIDIENRIQNLEKANQ